MRKQFLIVAASVVLAVPATGQGPDHSRMDMPGMAAHHAAKPVSAKAQQQIASVAKANQPLGAAGAAEAAGFKPLFGWIPTMGTHWVDGAKMMMGKQIDLMSPSQLMFTKINGRDSLVGAAYAYFTPVADTVRPATFDGNPSWHEHATLAPPGQTLVMLHVWFVASPDGPFAGTNPNLPFWAAGLAAPDAAKMKDAAYEMKLRRAGLAIAETVDSEAVFFPLGRRGRVVPPVLTARRDSVRALIPEIKAAQDKKDVAKFDKLTEKAALQWDAMQAAYIGTAKTDGGRARITEYFEMLLGEHGEH